jgi:hypothetical protein
MRIAGEEEVMGGGDGRTEDQAPKEFAAGWYADSQWAGERYWDCFGTSDLPAPFERRTPTFGPAS